jgi:hypothetical protein
VDKKLTTKSERKSPRDLGVDCSVVLKRNLTDGRYECVDWINLTKARDHWLNLVNTIMFSLLKAGNFYQLND